MEILKDNHAVSEAGQMRTSADYVTSAGPSSRDALQLVHPALHTLPLDFDVDHSSPTTVLAQGPRWTATSSFLYFSYSIIIFSPLLYCLIQFFHYEFWRCVCPVRL